MRKPNEHVVEMLFATKEWYPGSRRGAAIQRDADAAIAKQNLPYPVECVRIDWSSDDPSGRYTQPDVLQVLVHYREVNE